MPPYRRTKGKGKGNGGHKGKGKSKGKGRPPAGWQNVMYRAIGQAIRQAFGTSSAKVTQTTAKQSRKGRGKDKAESEEDQQEFMRAQEEKHKAHKEHNDRQCPHESKEFTGRMFSRTGAYGWIALDNIEELPEDLQQDINQMLKRKRLEMLEKKSTSTLFSTTVVFLHGLEMKDRSEWRLLHRGDHLKFKIYTDKKGVGAYDVQRT